jgi:HK97 gp10 family phage protein
MPKRVELATRKAMEKGAQELVDMMKRLVPIDQGDLRDSIGWTWGDAPVGTAVILQGRGGSEYAAMQITVYAGSDKAFYASYVEFGTKSGKPAHPFFFPSWRALRKRIKARILREQKKAIKFVGPVTQGET